MRPPSLLSLLVSDWQPVWTLELEAAVVVGVYVWATRRVRGGWPAGRTLSFLAGVGCVLVALQSGVDAFDDRLLSAHMIQHMLLLVVAPLLLLGGRPLLLALRVCDTSARRRLSGALVRTRPVTTPVTCLVVFYVVVLGTHLPVFYGATLRHPVLHDTEHGLYLLAGLLLWWPLLGGDPAPSRQLGGLGRLIYMLAAMPPMALVGAYLNRQPTLVYAPYGPPAHALGVSAVADQQHAGAIMWVGGNVIMVAVGLWVVIAALLAEERRLRSREARLDAAADPTGGIA